MLYKYLENKFVHFIPEQLEEGKFYISMDYATAMHLCCCGCGEKVITPFTPTDWKITFDGETISLWPSVGNWNNSCHSHYVIKQNKVIEASPWTDKQINEERKRDKNSKAVHYEEKRSVESKRNSTESPILCTSSKSLWSLIKGFFLTKNKP